MGEISKTLIYSTKQLKKIEEKELHDIWHLEDYFDHTKEIKYDNPIDPKIFAPFIKDDEERVVNYCHKFAHGINKAYGLLNVSFAYGLEKFLKNKIILYEDEVLKEVGLQVGDIRCRTHTYFGIARGKKIFKIKEEDWLEILIPISM
jgi:hypothetical protein